MAVFWIGLVNFICEIDRLRNFISPNKILSASNMASLKFPQRGLNRY